MDLLTVLAHEYGHVLGLRHEDGNGLMAQTLPIGVRRLTGMTGDHLEVDLLDGVLPPPVTVREADVFGYADRSGLLMALAAFYDHHHGNKSKAFVVEATTLSWTYFPSVSKAATAPGSLMSSSDVE
jgi:hypothetical protein